MTASAPQDSVLGRTIAGKYLIESSAGSGAMGTVYRARQIALDRIVALKILRREFEQNSEFVRRFSVEARAASKLDHPNSMRVIDFGREPDGLLYIAMEYLEGRDLYDAMHEEGPFSPARTANVIAQALSAIAVAHELGILHRDLKPENIMLQASTDDEGRAADIVKVCDFGIAKLSGFAELPHAIGALPSSSADNHGRLTRIGLIVGTPAYMSPEQASGDEVDARSDLYAIGVILFELLTGRVPFEGETPEDTVNMHLVAPPPNPLDINPMASPELSRICLKAMQKNAADRYATARDMRADVRAVMATDFGMAPSGPLPLPSNSRRLMETGSAPRVIVSTPPRSDMLTRPSMEAQRRRRSTFVGAGALLAVGIGVAIFARHALVDNRTASMAPLALSNGQDPAHATSGQPVAAGNPADSTGATGSATATADPGPPGTTTTTSLSMKVPTPAPGAAMPSNTSLVGAMGSRKPGGSFAATNTTNPAPPSPVVAAAAHPVTPAATPQAAPPVLTTPPTPAPPPVVAVAAPPPVAPPPVAAPAPPPFDPSRARVDMSGLSTERMTPRDANAIFARGDMKSCYVASVKNGEPTSPGSVTVSLEVEDMVVKSAHASGGGASLRKCLESRLVGSQAPSADTGTANASIHLTFSPQ